MVHSEVVRSCQAGRDTLFLVRHDRNQGCGGALVSGYEWAQQRDFQVVVRMDGDGQMNPDNLKSLISPVVTGRADYAKGTGCRTVLGLRF